MTTIPWIGICPVHQKRSYSSKKDAKSVVKQHPGKPKMTAYPCDASDGYWHVGHLPRKVVSGDIGRDKIRPARPRT